MPANKKTISIDGVIEDIISVSSSLGSSSMVFRMKSDQAKVSDFVAAFLDVKYPAPSLYREGIDLFKKGRLLAYAKDSVDLRYAGSIHSDCIGKPASYQLTIDDMGESAPSVVSGSLLIEVECSPSRKRVYEESCLFEAPKIPRDDEDDWLELGG